MFNNLTLKNRILFGYSVPIFCLIGIAGATFVNVQRASQQFDEVKREGKVLEYSQAKALGITKIEKSARGYLIKKTDTSRQQYEEGLKLFNNTGKDLKKLINDPEQKRIAQEMEELGQEVISYTSNLMRLVDQGKNGEALAIWREGKGKQLTTKLDKLIAEFMEREKEIFEQAEAKEAAILNSLNLVSILGTILASGISIAFAFWISDVIAKLIKQTISQLASSSNQIATTIEQQERTVNEQASSVSETTTTMDELGSSSRQSAEQAEASAQGAQQALSLAEEGTQAVQKTMSGMNNLKSKVNQIANQIVNLSQQTGEINNISDLVADLANQTNMLALNAAVEAARAGEQGSGFSVVAGEIRKLADESKKSAEKINGLIGEIQAEINKTVMVTDEGTKTVDQSINLAEETAQTFVGVTDAVNNVFINSQQISLGAKQQAVAIQQMLSAMKEIDLGARENASGITQIRNATSELNSTAQNLKTMV